MKRPELVIILGFILVTLGIILLSLSGSNYEGGFVFVFPFFFFGNVDSTGIVLISGFLLLTTLFVILMFNNWKIFSHQDISSQKIPTYVRYDTVCAFCGEQMPKSAEYCPTCGHIQDNKNQLDDPPF